MEEGYGEGNDSLAAVAAEGGCCLWAWVVGGMTREAPGCTDRMPGDLMAGEETNEEEKRGGGGGVEDFSACCLSVNIVTNKRNAADKKTRFKNVTCMYIT